MRETLYSSERREEPKKKNSVHIIYIPKSTNLFEVSGTLSIGHRVCIFLIFLVPMSLLSSS